MEEIVINTQYFNLKYTLECGQCFRWKKIYEDDKSISYIGVIKDRVLKVTQVGNVIHVKSNNFENEFESVALKNDIDEDIVYMNTTELAPDNLTKLKNKYFLR